MSEGNRQIQGTRKARKYLRRPGEFPGPCFFDPQKTIHNCETWLFANKGAMDSVRRGLSQAKMGKTVKAPENFRKYV